MLYERRHMFSNLSSRIGEFFAQAGISPNRWTLITFIPVALTMLFILQQAFLIASAFFILAAFIDMIDGAVARATSAVSRLGAYLDTIIDRYVEFLVLVPLILIPMPGVFLPFAFWLFVYLFGSMMTTYAKSAAKEKGIISAYEELKGGLLERAERLVILFIGLLLAGIFGTIWLTYVVVILAVLSNVSAIQRMAKAFLRANSLMF
jgi:phosphatidylglycerophosphate synthase